MQLLIDANILLYSVDRGSAEHARARNFLHRHLRSGTPWCLTWPVVYEFLRVSTHRHVFPRPLTAPQALRFIQTLLRSPSLIMLTPTSRHQELLARTVSELGTPSGNRFHDIATAVTLREHGVPEIITADSDFRQFSFLRVVNPL